MKTMFKSFSLLVVAACAGMSLASCNNEVDYFDPNKAEENTKASYEANFISQFGMVRADKSWDLSTKKTSYLTTRGTEGITTKSVEGINWGLVNNVPGANTALYNDLKTALPDGSKHEGKDATLLAPGNPFTIYPLVSVGDYRYKMYVQVGTEEPVLVFEKDWYGHDKHYCNGMAAKGGTDPKTKQRVDITVNMTGITIDAPALTPINIFLDDIKTTGGTVLSDENQHLGTLSGNAIFLDCDIRPTGIPADIMTDKSEIKYIGIEDIRLNASNCDKDYNDLVLLMIGNPDSPDDVIITDSTYTVSDITEKRYMVEDLGTTDDFDFNDIVVDLKQTISQTYKANYRNGVLVSVEGVGDPATSQEATIRALGGTIDFDLCIADKKVWTKSENFTPGITTMWNTGYKGAEIDWNVETYKLTDVTGWIPGDNNISVIVRNKANNGVQTLSETVIRFPERGAIPMIIATDVTENWMKERVRIPMEWATK